MRPIFYGVCNELRPIALEVLCEAELRDRVEGQLDRWVILWGVEGWGSL